MCFTPLDCSAVVRLKISSMERNIDRTFNEISEKMAKYEVAEIEGNKVLMEAYEKDVLTLSCKLLNELLGLLRDKYKELAKKSIAIGQLHADPRLLDDFLKLEAKLLREAGILPKEIEMMLTLLVEVVNSEGKVSANADNNWENTLQFLIDEVCPSAKKKAKRMRRKPLWKKIIIAATGGIVVLVDLPAVYTFPLAAFSVPAGLEVIKKAGDSAADDFLE